MLEEPFDAHVRLNALSTGAAREALTRCCGVASWVEGMLTERPYPSSSALLSSSDAKVMGLLREQKLEAFAQHPEIGASVAELRERFQSTAALSSREQAGVEAADELTLSRLRDGNRAYRARFGHVFIVFASGKSAAEMLALLEARLENSPDQELEIAARELAKITRARLERIAE